MSEKKAKPSASSEKLKLQAKMEFEKGDYIKAIELFSYALEQVPNYAPYLTNRALCYYRLQKAEKVLKDATTSIQSDPQWTKGYFYKGKAHEMLHEKQEAINSYRKCCQLEPNNEEYRNVLHELTNDSTEFNKSCLYIQQHDALCDVCSCNPIVGVRYRCSICEDYDMCSKCVNINPNQKGHKDSHPLIPIKNGARQISNAHNASEIFSSNPSEKQIDISMKVHSYNIVLVIDVSLSMIGYESNNRVNPFKNRWPATERGIIKIANQLCLNDLLTCLAFNAAVYEIMDGQTANIAKLQLALVLSTLKPSIEDRNPGTALYDAIQATFNILLRKKFASLLNGNNNRNQIILITDGEDCSSTKSNLNQACQHIQQMCYDFLTDILLIGIGLEAKGRIAMQALKKAGGERCKFLDLSDLSELDDLFDRISLVFTQREAVINV